MKIITAEEARKTTGTIVEQFEQYKKALIDHKEEVTEAIARIINSIINSEVSYGHYDARISAHELYMDIRQEFPYLMTPEMRMIFRRGENSDNFANDFLIPIALDLLNDAGYKCTTNTDRHNYTIHVEWD